MRLSPVLIGGCLFCIAQMSSSRAEDIPSNWEASFPVAGAPTRVYFRAHYTDGRGESHELQVWRNGDREVRRRTDAAIDLYADKDNAGNLDYRIVDHTRNVVIHADRLALYRVGRFPNWRGLAHVLDIPIGSYMITALPQPPQSTQFGECKWIRLQVDQLKAPSNVCWSQAWGIPLMINGVPDGKEKIEFSIEEVREFQPNEDTIFIIDDKNLVEVDERSGSDPSD
jgi:hypothetical protein